MFTVLNKKSEAVLSTCIPMHTANHVTAVFDLLTSGSVHVEGLSCTICSPNLVLTVQVIDGVDTQT